MDLKVNLNTIYAPSAEVVAREVGGEFIIIPIASGIGELDEIFTLNDIGRTIWDELDGKKKLKEVVSLLSSKFEGLVKEIEKDVLGLTKELLKKKILVEIAKG